jgi:cytochrome o ubiquinol oxidase subunit 2
MNAFFVPQLGSQIYTMPGMTTHLNLLADHPGSYAGISSHFSGDGFSDMRFVVKAVTPGEFEAWAAQAHGGRTLDDAAYSALARPSSNSAVETFGAVESHLYEKILELAAPGSVSMAAGSSAMTTQEP